MARHPLAVAAWAALLTAVLVVSLLPKPAEGRDISRRQHRGRRPRDGPTASSSAGELTEIGGERRHRPRPEQQAQVVIEPPARCTDCAEGSTEGRQTGRRRLRNRRKQTRRRKGRKHARTASSSKLPTPRTRPPHRKSHKSSSKGRQLHSGRRDDVGKGHGHLDTSQMQAEPPASPAFDRRPQRDFWDVFGLGGTKEETQEITTEKPTTETETDDKTKTNKKKTQTDDKKKTQTDDKKKTQTDGKKKTKADKKETSTDGRRRTRTNARKDKKENISGEPALASIRVQRPPEADRLERRLHPNVGLAIRDLANTMDRVLQTIGNRLVTSGYHYDVVYNHTRHSMMMGTRKLIKEIVTVNDNVYDTVMQASLMTKEVYLRAHRHGLSGPTTASLRRPQPRFPSLRDSLYTSRNEETQAASARSKVEDLVRRCARQDTRLEALQERVKQRYGLRALEDLKIRVTEVMRMLRTDFPQLSRIPLPPTDRRPSPIRGELGEAMRDVQEGRQLLQKARESVSRAQFNWNGMRRAISGMQDPGAPVQLQAAPLGGRWRHRRQAGGTTSSLSPAERRQAVRDMKAHAASLQQQARQAERLLRPLINRGRNFAGNQSTDALVLSQTLVARDRLLSDVKRLHVLLDRLRLLVGNEEELQARCRELGEEGQGSGAGGVGEEGEEAPSVIDCEALGEGSAEGPTPLTPPEGRDPDPDIGDFEFVDEVVLGGAPSPSPISRFGRSLNTYVFQLKQQCQARLQRASRAKSRTSNMSRRLAKVRDAIASVSQAGTDIKDVRNQLQRQEAELRALSAKVKTVHAEVESSHNTSQQRALEALAKANRRLQEVKDRSGTGSRGATAGPAPSGGGVDLTAALTKSAEARRAVNSLRSEGGAVTGECGGVVGRVTSLQANIAQLRRRLHLARLLLASTQVSVQKKGPGFLTVPVEGELSPPSLLSLTELCLRPAGLPGTVLLVKGNNSVSYHLEMASKKLALTAYDMEGSKVGSVESDRDLEDDQWYGVKMLREGSSLSLTVTTSEGESSTQSTRISSTSLPLLQPEPAALYIGGGPPDLGVPVRTGEWEGCVGGLRTNGRSLAVLRSSSEGQPASPCSSHCSSGRPSLVFHGQGFLHLSPDLLRVPLSSLQLQFRTTQDNALVLALLNSRQREQVRVLVSEGTLVVEARTRREQSLLISRNNTFSDGRFHRLKIVFGGKTYPELDGQDGQFTVEGKQPALLSQAAQGLLLGAMVAPDYSFLPSAQGGIDPLIGCVRDLKINDKEVSPSKILEARGVNYGGCNKASLWASCVRFGEKSRAYEVEARADLRSMSLLVSPQARGPLLLLSNEKDFSLQLELDEAGVSMTESVQSSEKQLPWPKDASQHHFLPLSITDDGKSTLTVRAWEGQSFTLSYDSGWFYARSSDPSSLTLGSDQDGNRLLQGSLAQLLVDGKLVHLAAEKHSHGYQGCSRGLPDPGVQPTPEPFTLAC